MENTPPDPPHHLPPGLGAGQVALVTGAAESCLAALDAPRNWAMDEQLPVDLARAVFERYAAGAGGWAEADLVQVLDARGALREATDALRAAHDARGEGPDTPPSALEDAESLIAAMNTLYVELDTALRRIAPETVETARTDLAAARDVSVPQATAAPEVARVDAAAAPVAADIERAQEAIRKTYALVNVENLTLIRIGDVAVTVERLKAQLASIHVSVRASAVWQGTVQLAAEGVEAALEAVRRAGAAMAAAAETVTDAAEAVSGVLAPLADLVEEGRALIETVRGAVRRLFGPREEAPWPTGLRLPPPEGRADAPRDVALVAVRRFETGDDDVFGLTPLPGGRFVSGGSDGVLRLWSVDQATPLAELRGHSEEINGIAALDGRRVVTASDDLTLILWDLEARAARETFREHGGIVRDVAALDRERFVSVADRDDCRLWSTERAEAGRVWTFADPRGVAALAPDRVATVGHLDFRPFLRSSGTTGCTTQCGEGHLTAFCPPNFAILCSSASAFPAISADRLDHQRDGHAGHGLMRRSCTRRRML